ncbi:unnamed protein product [Linum tenue]|uniref:Uncharacterized protein n=1 Tax=Linum tenue TaxID=586396 RepID=A0AAV0M0T1_9ROSI|nr:unnamed protein product [Linum tenue]
MERILSFAAKLKLASFLWLEGFLEACCLHRAFLLCRRSKKLLIRTGQCFLLNGFIFLGRYLFVSLYFEPRVANQNVLHLGRDSRYDDIAKHAFAAMENNGRNLLKPSGSDEVAAEHKKAPMEQPPGLEGVFVGIGEQVYSVLLVIFFSAQVNAVGIVPFVGKALSFVLQSWMYKWNLSEVPLDRKLDFFETNWPFFVGFGNYALVSLAPLNFHGTYKLVICPHPLRWNVFVCIFPGSPCVLASFFFSTYVSYGVMATLFPLASELFLRPLDSRHDEPGSKSGYVNFSFSD